MVRFCEIADEFADRADFLVVYIEEAHAQGEFDFSSNRYNFSQHKGLDDRIAAAEQMIEEMQGKMHFPTVVDNMYNGAMYAYGARPERIYIILDGVIMYQGKRGPYYNDMREFNSRLSQLCS